jgi:hypothetical protein
MAPRCPIVAQSKEYEWELPRRLLPLGHTPNYSQLAAQEGNGYEHCPYHNKGHNRFGKYANMKDMVNWREKLKLREQIYKVDQIFSAHDPRVI